MSTQIVIPDTTVAATFTPIDYFMGEHRWLSNFYPRPVFYNGLLFDNSESAYQAGKFSEISVRHQFLGVEGRVAKRRSKKFPMSAFTPEVWDSGARDIIMREVLERKFSNMDLAGKLIQTGARELIEGNYWHDVHFGVCNGKCKHPHSEPIGDNMLGKLLMEIRTGLKASFKQRLDSELPV